MIPESASLAIEGDHVGIVDEAVDHDGGDGAVAADLATAAADHWPTPEATCSLVLRSVSALLANSSDLRNR